MIKEITGADYDPQEEIERVEWTQTLPKQEVVEGSVALVDKTGENIVRAGGEYAIRFQVKNLSGGAVKNCKVDVTPTMPFTGIEAKNPQPVNFAGKEVKTIEVPIVADLSTEDGQVEISVRVHEPNGHSSKPFYTKIMTRAYEAPLIRITDYSVTAKNGTTLQKKQPFNLQLMLQSVKRGEAQHVSTTIELPPNVILLDGENLHKVGTLKGGEAKSLVYQLFINNNYEGTTIPISVYLFESNERYAEDRTINLTLDQAMASKMIDVKAMSQQQTKNDIAIATLGSDVDKDIPVATEAQKNTFVVIIANEHYQMVDGVPFANNDETMFEAYCRQTLGIPQKNIRLVKDGTLNVIKFQIDWLRQVMETFNGQASAIVYYAGHGIPDEQSHASYLLPTDGYPSNTSSAYSLDELYQTLGNMPARSITMFLDACFSGSKRDGTILASARGVAIKAKGSAPQGKMIVFSAAQGDETAYPYEEQHHGMSTYYLLKKLKDSNGNATLGELSDYVTLQVKQQSIVENSKLQTPTVNASSAIGNNWRKMKLK